MEACFCLRIKKDKKVIVTFYLTSLLFITLSLHSELHGKKSHLRVIVRIA